ncbi:hypothetical protein UR09_06815, partial [Candidatus Nitromaritima sp. SCGC AAA799-A02]
SHFPSFKLFFRSNINVPHIMESVPRETSAYKEILKIISSGGKNPDDLNRALREHFFKGAETKFSDAFLSTQRSGAISRMVDLGLIRRIRAGVKVRYSIPKSGKEFLKQSTIR